MEILFLFLKIYIFIIASSLGNQRKKNCVHWTFVGALMALPFNLYWAYLGNQLISTSYVGIKFFLTNFRLALVNLWVNMCVMVTICVKPNVNSVKVHPWTSSGWCAWVFQILQPFTPIFFGWKYPKLGSWHALLNRPSNARICIVRAQVQTTMGAALAIVWVMSLSVGLGLAPNLIIFMSFMRVDEWGFDEGGWGDV